MKCRYAGLTKKKITGYRNVIGGFTVINVLTAKVEGDRVLVWTVNMQWRGEDCVLVKSLSKHSRGKDE